MTDRATCWSITINNPEATEYNVVLPIGWKLEGQLEQGEQGTIHYQGCLRTPQVRFSQVKKQFPRAHIEVARNQKALQQYVRKEETRVAVVESIPTMFQYQDSIARKWDEDAFRAKLRKATESAITKFPDIDDLAMEYVDSLVSKDIEEGKQGVEFLAINPMWRSSWKRFWRSIIKRNARACASQQTENGEESPSSDGTVPSSAPQGSGESDGSLLQGEVPSG